VQNWIFVNRLTKRSTPEHPYAPAMRGLVRGALRRHAAAQKAARAGHELLTHDWVQFAIPRGGSRPPAPQWHNLRTGERSDEFPRFPATTPREAVYFRDSSWREQARTVRCYFEASGVRWMVGSGSGAPKSSQALAAQHSTSRAVALRRRPRLMIEVIYAAEVLGIDPVRT
jgi:hypothetical protein